MVGALRSLRPISGQVSKQMLMHALKRFNSNQSPEVWKHKSAYKWFMPIQTRWKVSYPNCYVTDTAITRCIIPQDNDIYGHVNNAVYNSMFDTTINIYLINYCNLTPTLESKDPIGFMVTNVT